MRIILFFLVTFVFSFAQEKLLITHFENLKPYYYNNQIVNLKLKIISAKDGDIKIFDDKNKSYNVVKQDSEYISKLSFQIYNDFPTFKVVLKDNFGIIAENNISIDSEIKSLYPPKNFCKVLADNLEISDTILTNYDKNSNMVYWTIKTKNGNIKDFSLGFKDEKLYFLEKNNTITKYSYSAIVPIYKKDFDLSFFDLKMDKYQNIKFHINIKNDVISTQTDIKPMGKNNLYIINGFLIILVLLWLILYFYRRKIIYIILIILVLISLVFFNKPKDKITLYEGTKIHILPFDKSTVFLVTSIDTKVKVLEEKNGYKKVEFNKYIGWIKDE